MMTLEQKTKIYNLAQIDPCYGIDIFGRHFINKLLKKLDDNEIVLELGTWMGGTLQYMASQNPNLNFHSIDLCDSDLWYKMYASNTQSLLYSFLQKADCLELDKTELIEVQKAHLVNLKNVTTHQGNSTSLNLNDIGLLLVDSDHNTDHILCELNYYWPRMKKDRFVVMDDFYHYQVKEALTQFKIGKDIKTKTYGNIVLLYT